MRYPKLREIKGALKSLFTKPYTTKFPAKPHIPYTSFRGKPYYHEDKCLGCTACVNVCPAGALSYQDVKEKDKVKRILKIEWDVCIRCGQCELHCPTKEGIVLSNEFDSTTTQDRKELYQTIEKEMVVCDCCHSVIASYDQILWVIERLGPLYASNTFLLYFKQRICGLSVHIEKTSSQILRADRFRLLCPRCRREAVFTS